MLPFCLSFACFLPPSTGFESNERKDLVVPMQRVFPSRGRNVAKNRGSYVPASSLIYLNWRFTMVCLSRHFLTQALSNKPQEFAEVCVCLSFDTHTHAHGKAMKKKRKTASKSSRAISFPLLPYINYTHNASQLLAGGRAFSHQMKSLSHINYHFI